MSRVASPADRNIPNTHEANSAWVKPPAAPTASVTAMGPEAEKTAPRAPLAA